jgi:hypothetical protein
MVQPRLVLAQPALHKVLAGRADAEGPVSRTASSIWMLWMLGGYECGRV